MKAPRRRFLQHLGTAAALLSVPRIASAQPYPSRPLTMIVPFPAGGATTTLARVLAEHLKETLGQPVVVENVGGAGGSIGVSRSARAGADGYSLSFGNWASHVGAGAVYPVAYDVLADFEPVARVADTPLWVVARKALPAKRPQRARRVAQSQPGEGIGRALSRRRPRDSGLGRRTSRLHV
jgi:tripartite-type tricarboxylate transporter receptor subunit TctC